VSFANDVSESEVPLAGFQGETLNDLGGGLGGGLLVTQYSSSEERIGLAQTYRPWCAEVGYIRSSPQREYSPRNIPSETSPTRRGFAPGPLASLADLKVVPRGRSQPPSLWNPYTRGVHLGRTFPDARGMITAPDRCVRSRAGGMSAGFGETSRLCTDIEYVQYSLYFVFTITLRVTSPPRRHIRTSSATASPEIPLSG